MARSSWTRRLDDRVLGSTGVLIVLALLCLSFVTWTISSALHGKAVMTVVDGVLAVLSGQAVRTQWRSRQQTK